MASNAGILPPEVSQRLSQLERTVRSLSLVRGCGLAMTVFYCSLGVGLLVDYLLDLGLYLRCVMLVSVGVATALAIWKGVVRTAMHSLTQTELAAMVEAANPKLNERLTSTIELNDPNTPEQFRGSKFMRAHLEKQCRKSVSSINFFTAVSARPMQKSLVVAILATCFVAAPFLVWPSAYRTLLQRFFQPWANIGRVTNLYFEVPDGSRVIAKGSDVEITAVPKWRRGDDNERPTAVMLNQTGQNGRTESRRMRFREDDGAFFILVPHVLQPFDYDVSADSARSEQHSIDVVAGPEIKTVQLNIEPPAYTGLPATLIDGAVGQIEAFERSQMTFDVEFSKPVESAELVWLSAIESIDGDDESAQLEPDALPLQLNDDGTQGSLQMLAKRSGRFAFRVVDEFELENEDKADRYLSVLRDQPPTLHVAGNDAPDEAHPQDVIAVRVAAADDIGLSELEFHIEIGHNEQNKSVVRKMEDGPNGKRELTHEFSLNLSEFEVQEGVLVAWRVRATDERPIPGPNETWSSRRFLTITSEAAAPGAQQLAFEQKQMQDELERIIKKIQKNRDETRGMKNDLWKPGKNQNDPEDNKRIEEIAAEQTELTDDLESLNDRLDEHPLFEKLVENSREVSRKLLPEAGEHFEAARQETNNKGNRANKLTQAERKLNEADWKLQNVLREFDKLAELERDLLELQRMANQAEQVAHNADEIEKQREQLEDLPEGQQKRQAENELANQQHALAEEQQQLSQELNDLLDRRPEMIEAAKRAQLERLQELAEQAQQLVEPQQQLQHAFREEGDDAANEARKLDQEEQELLSKAQDLARQAREAGAIDPKATERALQDAIAALEEGDLARAQELQNKAQAELDQLAETIRTPNDPRAAVEKMAKQQRGLADKLKKQADSNEPADRKRDELQKLAREQEQLQKTVANTNLPKGHDAAQQQAAQQADAAKQQSRDGNASEAAKKANEAADSLEKLARQLPSIDELRKQAAEQVAELRRQQEANREQTQQNGVSDQTKQNQQDLSEQLSDLVAPDAAREAGEAAERSASASQELAKNNSERAVREQQQTEQQLARIQEKLDGKPTSDERLQKLQKEQQDVATAAHEAYKDEDNKDPGKQQAQQQQQIANELSELDTPAAEAQKQAATDAAQEAARQLKSGDQRQAERSLQQAQEAMQELADALGNQPQGAEQPQQRASAQEREQLAEQAQQLAEEIAELEKRLEQSRQDRLAQNAPEADAQSNADPNNADRQNANQNKSAGEPAQDPVEQALAEQRQIAQDAARLAQDVARQNGQKSAAARDAQAMAAEARDAAMHAQSGRFNAARDINKAGARKANETRKTLGKDQQPADAPPGQSNEQLAKRASELGEQMQQASEKMTSMAQSPNQRNQAQIDQQDALQQATQDIAEAMQAASARLKADPLNMQQQSETGQNASEAAQQASDSQQQAQEHAEQGNASSASQMAQQAAESLQQAARQARQAAIEANKFQNSPVPNEVGTQVADAVEQLRKAAEQLAQQMDANGDQQMAQSDSDSSQQQQPGENGKQSGQPSDSQQGQPGQDGQPQPGQDGQPGQEGKPQDGQQGKPSNQPGKQNGKPGESMRDAARSLADAAKNSQPSQAKSKGGKPQQGEQVSANMNEPSQLPEGVSAADLQRLLPGLMKPDGKRNWGKLPGTLQTEILQAAKKNPNTEYARLIKLYFKQIAGSGRDDK